MIQDGYGDQFDYAEQRIAELDRLNVIRAHQWSRPYVEADDLLQEARTAVWEAAEQSRDKDDPRAWLSTVAARRVSEVAQRQTWTGHTRVHGQPTDPLRQQAKQSLDDPEFTLTESLDGPGWLASAELSYHRGEIMQALATLTPRQRQYVALRFWYGYTHMEIKREFKMSDSTWDAAKRNLRESLAHLAAAN